ncbi:aminopeptidase [Nitzschia inconspicua]|uniref:aspartyl aminopeptidase n=1 Tax=Nitzschia inconspicua TaxID=303405 RepID=A0A9K3PVJ6_9STRA|nr:aminopeptidase [Nitzschia inconspicua]
MKVSRRHLFDWSLLFLLWKVLIFCRTDQYHGCHCYALSAVPLPPMTTTAEHLPLARQAMEYFDRSTDPFHAVQTSIDLLKQAGFQELDETSHGAPSSNLILPGGKYFYTRNKSTLVAFAVGEQFTTTGGGGGFKIIGGHTDSPNLRVKPRSKRGAKSAKSIQIGAECYGGGLWHTWFDRDLGLSGRVFVRNNERIEQRLVQIPRAVLRIPNLAIHLQTADERKAFKINQEDHLSPILAMAAQKALTGDVTDDDKETDDDAKPENATSKVDGWTEHQEPLLLQLLATEMNVPLDDIVDFELNLFDIQMSSLGGVHSEFVHSARLDNLASCFLAIRALIDCVGQEEYLQKERDISMVVLYDHEEVGSSSAVGAAGPITKEAVKRISAALNAKDQYVASYDLYESTIRKSFILSSDQAHALHPNYASKHEKNHQPQMNAGMVIKRNSNQRYATNGATGVVIREIARRAGLPPVQEFIVRQDCGCGSTIGPLLSTATGIRAIDLGCPQLSMHSIRETMGVCDLTNGLKLFKAFFVHFRSVDDSLEQ